MNIRSAVSVIVLFSALGVGAKVPVNIVRPKPTPALIADVRKGEKPVDIETTESTVEENSFFKRLKYNIVFTNRNNRDMAGDLELPLPEGAFVCGYSLEINGEMIPGVVCEKDKARVAFENEERKYVDPGIVEHVKGNVWRTRIFPIRPNIPRKAEVEYIVPKLNAAKNIIYERDGEEVFVAYVADDGRKAQSVRSRIAAFKKGVVVWDASLSAKQFAASWCSKLKLLPDNGEWRLVVFRHDVKLYQNTFSKDSLLKEIESLQYDGGTCIDAALKSLALDGVATEILLFTDEVDTMGLEAVAYDSKPQVTVASRDDTPLHSVEVKKLPKGDKSFEGAPVKNSLLLATVWAERYMRNSASQANARKDEFLDLARRYGVAGPGQSFIVLENVSQYIEHKIEPHPSLSIHAQWKRMRASEDDGIAAKRLKAEHEENLLKLWHERVKWWNDPKPPKRTPKSGVFDSQLSSHVAIEGEAGQTAPSPRTYNRRRMMRREGIARNPESVANVAVESVAEGGDKHAKSVGDNNNGAAVVLKAWDPKAPYLELLKSAPIGSAYNVYLKEREKYNSSPAFYLDCASWFYKAGEQILADRILTNLAEFNLENPALWRSIGWRAREAGRYELAILAFRKVLVMRREEAQSRRDLAIVLGEWGKKSLYTGKCEKDAAMHIEEAMRLLADAAFMVVARRSGLRNDDFQIAVIALEELNGLIAWVEAYKWQNENKPKIPQFDAVYRRDLPMKLRIVMSWDADRTDVDLHVLEPNGEEAFYQNRRTSEGGFVSGDVTTGYGPEEYLKKDSAAGVYKIMSNYFASHQSSLTGAVTISVGVYTDWGTANEKFKLITFRLDKPKDKFLIGEIKMQ